MSCENCANAYDEGLQVGWKLPRVFDTDRYEFLRKRLRESTELLKQAEDSYEFSAQHLCDVLVHAIGLGVDLTCPLPKWCAPLLANSWSQDGEMTPEYAIDMLVEGGMRFE